jgi:hypothetical protein
VGGLGLLIFPGMAWSSGAGTTGGEILNIPVGARAIGMGEAYTAQADDASSLYWNPAGIAILNQSEASFTYNPFLKDLSYQNASVAVPLENGGLGASLSYLSYGTIQGFDENGIQAGTVNAYSGVATLGGAWLGNNWSAGFNLKGVQESLADVTANGFAADLGTNWVYPNEVMGGSLRAAAVVRNLGTGLKFINQNDSFPTQWRLGLAAVQMMDRRLNLSLDYGQETGLNGAVYGGAEYWVLPYIALRAGYAGSQAEGNGARAGIGLKYKDVSFNFAYSNYGDLGFSQLYELSFRFGTIQPRLTPEERKMFHRAKVAMEENRYDEATVLLDALIRMEPNYKPFQRLVKGSIAGYEKQEVAQSKRFNFSTLQSSNSAKPARPRDMDEAQELENLLNLSQESYARANQAGTDSVKSEKSR